MPTGHKRIPYLIVAPTMFLPEPVESANAPRAMRAILRIADNHRGMIEELWCPGLCTGVGQVSPEVAAEQMALAYGQWQAARLTV